MTFSGKCRFQNDIRARDRIKPYISAAWILSPLRSILDMADPPGTFVLEYVKISRNCLMAKYFQFPRKTTAVSVNESN